MKLLTTQKEIRQPWPTDRPTDRPIRKVCCLFEQSGTFKNEFKKLGIDAYDYDVLNDFKQTDFETDLFAEIEKCFDGEDSIFDDFSSDDLIMAFFPCTRFEPQILLSFWQKGSQHKHLPLETKLKRDLQLQKELTENYNAITKLVIICLRKQLRLIIENPYNKSQHYLTTHWCIEPNIIDMDRRKNGDAYKKPTQYWFINCEPKNNILFEPLDYIEPTTTNGKSQVQRSMISPCYARRFIKQYILEREFWEK